MKRVIKLCLCTEVLIGLSGCQTLDEVVVEEPNQLPQTIEVFQGINQGYQVDPKIITEEMFLEFYNNQKVQYPGQDWVIYLGISDQLYIKYCATDNFFYVYERQLNERYSELIEIHQMYPEETAQLSLFEPKCILKGIVVDDVTLLTTTGIPSDYIQATDEELSDFLLKITPNLSFQSQRGHLMRDGYGRSWQTEWYLTLGVENDEIDILSEVTQVIEGLKEHFLNDLFVVGFLGITVGEEVFIVSTVDILTGEYSLN